MSASEMVPVIVIAGVSSGVGKTTVTLGLLEALHRRGLAVQAFKVGPDFIDPAFHSLATGRPSYNLDGWMCGRDQVMATVGERAAQADLALVEGVMGCFDGTDGLTEDGSTAQIAKWLGAPVVLVLDAGALARSAAAVHHCDLWRHRRSNASQTYSGTLQPGGGWRSAARRRDRRLRATGKK